MKHFTLIEVDADSESLMIGTILNVTTLPQGMQSFKERAKKAIENHFDAKLTDDGNIEKFAELILTGSPYEEVTINTEGDGEDDYVHTIKILETWIY